MLGVLPTEPDPELGYLSLGDALGDGTRAGHRVRREAVAAPRREAALGGALWNTMVTCGTVDALWELAREPNRALIDILDAFVPLVGTADEDDAIESDLPRVPGVSFSRDMLERAPGNIAAIELEGVEWSDWGAPSASRPCLRAARARSAAVAASPPPPMT